MLAPALEQVRLVYGQILFEPGRVPSHVHFPHAGTMISLVLPLRDGRECETITVGSEGLAGLGTDPTDTTVETFVRGIVQMPGDATRIPTERLAEVAAASPPLRRLLVRYAEAAMSMALQSVACNAAHPLRARLARWLLVALDRAAPGSGGRLALTQEFIAVMLGVRRATVGDALLAFQAEGFVRLQRGGLVILDRKALGATACECHAAVRRRYAYLLPEVEQAGPDGAEDDGN
ncbi:MAG: Crp/Fnr family transcriptional regulator [Acetobacteraceae bacterium]|nr:MAG: Crp/Fnr family transcriptional regulator [Acetobacteraceae bacterium]